MLLDHNERPIPPRDIVERLQRVDDRLGLRWVGDWWAITMRWVANDPRREKIQKNQIANDPHDVVTFLPKDCTADEAFGYLERHFVRTTGSKDEIARMLSRLHKYNEEQMERNLQETKDLADELISTNAKTLFEGKHIPKTKAPRGKKNLDQKRLEEYLRDNDG